MSGAFAIHYRVSEGNFKIIIPHEHQKHITKLLFSYMPPAPFTVTDVVLYSVIYISLVHDIRSEL